LSLFAGVDQRAEALADVTRALNKGAITICTAHNHGIYHRGINLSTLFVKCMGSHHKAVPDAVQVRLVLERSDCFWDQL
jgi:hypothetical protein